MSEKVLNGSCVCGQLTYHLDVNDTLNLVSNISRQLNCEGTNMNKTTSVCHCRDCRKISGGTMSLNLTIPASSFHLTTGDLTSVELKHSIEGFIYSLSFCKTCGSPIFAEPSFLPSMRAIQVGTLDDVSVLQQVPSIELNVKDRMSWAHCIVGAEQRKGYTA